MTIIIKSFLLLAALLCKVPVSLAQRARGANICENGDIKTFKRGSEEIFLCFTDGGDCDTWESHSTTNFPRWDNFESAEVFETWCDDDSQIGLCHMDKKGDPHMHAKCDDGYESFALIVHDYQRRRLGEPREKGMLVREKGARVKVEIDGEQVVIIDAKFAE